MKSILVSAAFLASAVIADSAAPIPTFVLKPFPYDNQDNKTITNLKYATQTVTKVTTYPTLTVSTPVIAIPSKPQYPPKEISKPEYPVVKKKKSTYPKTQEIKGESIEVQFPIKDVHFYPLPIDIPIPVPIISTSNNFPFMTNLPPMINPEQSLIPPFLGPEDSFLPPFIEPPHLLMPPFPPAESSPSLSVNPIMPQKNNYKDEIPKKNEYKDEKPKKNEYKDEKPKEHEYKKENPQMDNGTGFIRDGRLGNYYGPQVQAGPNYGAPTQGGPNYGAPAQGGPNYGAPTQGGPNYGAPAQGGPNYGAPTQAGPNYGAPAQGGQNGGVPSSPSSNFAWGTSQAVPPTPLICPDLSRCKSIKGLGYVLRAITNNSGTICLYDVGQTSTCNLSYASSFCSIQGTFFDASRIFIDYAGNTHLRNC